MWCMSVRTDLCLYVSLSVCVHVSQSWRRTLKSWVLRCFSSNVNFLSAQWIFSDKDLKEAVKPSSQTSLIVRRAVEETRRFQIAKKRTCQFHMSEKHEWTEIPNNAESAHTFQVALRRSDDARVCSEFAWTFQFPPNSREEKVDHAGLTRTAHDSVRLSNENLG